MTASWSYFVLGPFPGAGADAGDGEELPSDAIVDGSGAVVGTSDSTYTGDGYCLEADLAHADEGVALFIQQFKKSTRLQSLARVFLDQIQELENAMNLQWTQLTLDNASGVHLANIGKRVGEPDTGIEESEYRRVIRGRIQANRSEGTIDDLNGVIRAVYTLAEMPFTIIEWPDAEIEIEMTGIPWVTIRPLKMWQLLDKARSAGVWFSFRYMLSAPADVFTTAAVANVSSIDTARGLANIAQTSGGRLAGNYSG